MRSSVCAVLLRVITARCDAGRLLAMLLLLQTLIQAACDIIDVQCDWSAHGINGSRRPMRRLPACIVAYIRLSACVILLSILMFNIALYVTLATSQSIVNATDRRIHILHRLVGHHISLCFCAYHRLLSSVSVEKRRPLTSHSRLPR